MKNLKKFAALLLAAASPAGGRFPCLNYIEQKPGLSMGEFPKKSETDS